MASLPRSSRSQHERRRARRPIPALPLLLLLTATALPARAQQTPWHLTGDLSEACSCSVPCPCNFGESPGPHHFCWALWSLDIQTGNYGDVDLKGLHLAGANGSKGSVLYLDARADKEQMAALKSIAGTIYKKFLAANGVKPGQKPPPDLRLLGIKTAKIEQTVGDKSAKLRIGDAGQFVETYITGIDGKTPVVVENNSSWNIQHGIKGKTGTFRYRDGYGNAFDFKATNANEGIFDWSDTTPIYFR